MIQKSTNEKLRKVANFAVFYQFFSVLILMFFTILGNEYQSNFITFIGIFIVLVYSLYILNILIFSDNICPNCNGNFFKKNETVSNLGFSIYTKKCTNCGYKV